MPPTIPTDRLRSLIAAELPDLIALRRDLHAHPELGYAETRTSSVVRRELERAGVAFVGDLAGGTGVLGHVPASGAGSVGGAIGLRADMDALPIVEETGLEYASRTPGTMHACGHDGHTTILLGAARVLAALAQDHALPRPVTFVFQPAEEGGAGGKRMVEDGCLRGEVLGPPVTRMFGLHGWPTLALGDVATRVGPLLAAADRFEITITGTGTHAAYPHTGRDPVVAACAIVTTLQTIASRTVDPLDAIVVSATQIHGGSTHNIIPCVVVVSGTVRTLAEETQKLAMERLDAIAAHTARAHGCTARTEYIVGYPITVNHADAVAEFQIAARAAAGDAHVQDVPRPHMGGEDFSYYCREVPSCFFCLGLLPEGAATMPQLHQPTFDFNDQAIGLGVEVMCRLAVAEGTEGLRD